MRAVVVGGCGFLGSHVCTKLTARGIDVLSVHRSIVFGSHGPWECHSADYRDKIEAERYLRGADILIHLGSQSVPRTSMELGVSGILDEVSANARLFEAAAAADVGRVVFASSGGSVYGECKWGSLIKEEHPLRPISPHGLLKVMTELVLAQVAQWSGQLTVSLRPANVYGPGQGSKRMFGVVPTYVTNLLEGRPSEVWGAEVVRDYVYVDDAAEEFVLAATLERPLPPMLNVGTGVGHTALEVYAILQEVVGKTIPITVTARPPADPRWNVLDTGKATEALSHEARTDIRTGLTSVVELIASERAQEEPTQV